MSTRDVLTAAEKAIMQATFRSTMLRAADLIDRITDQDVLEAQAVQLSEGMKLDKVAKIDRAMLAAAHLRACVKTNERKHGA